MLNLSDLRKVSVFRPSLQVNAGSRNDPSGTGIIQRGFDQDVNQRFEVFSELVKEKALLMLGEYNYVSPFILADIPMSIRAEAADIQEFLDWLDEKIEQGLLTVAGRHNTRFAYWSDRHIEAGYRQGLDRASGDLAKFQFGIPGMLGTGGIHINTMALLFLQTYEELRGITREMARQIARELAMGVAGGLSPRDVARNLVRVIEITRKRAILIARTELIRAHHRAMVNTFREAGVVGVKILAEWLTAGDNRVCKLCLQNEGKVFTLDEVEMLIPLHPLCRCVIIPVLV